MGDLVFILVSILFFGLFGLYVRRGGIDCRLQADCTGIFRCKIYSSRPSAAGQGYDASSSGGSNLGPTSQKLVDTVRQRVLDYRTENNLGPDILVPADAVTASGSGLDPHISPRNALLQAGRVAGARGLSLQAVHEKIKHQTEGRDFGILGEPRVNVLMLKLALDGQ